MYRGRGKTKVISGKVINCLPYNGLSKTQAVPLYKDTTGALHMVS